MVEVMPSKFDNFLKPSSIMVKRERRMLEHAESELKRIVNNLASANPKVDDNEKSNGAEQARLNKDESRSP